MEIKKKILNALSQSLLVDYIRLDDEDGVTGFVVSPTFEKMSSFDRQTLIRDTLDRLTPGDRRRVVMIAGLTPIEYASAGVPIRVYKVKEKAVGNVSVFFLGDSGDGEYLQKLLHDGLEVKMSAPKPVPDAFGASKTFRVRGSADDPLTKDKVLRILKKDRYVEVLADA